MQMYRPWRLQRQDRGSCFVATPFSGPSSSLSCILTGSSTPGSQIKFVPTTELRLKPGTFRLQRRCSAPVLSSCCPSAKQAPPVRAHYGRGLSTGSPHFSALLQIAVGGEKRDTGCIISRGGNAEVVQDSSRNCPKLYGLP